MNRTIWTERGSLEQLRSAWQALFDRTPAAPVFSSWEWVATWWAHFGGTRHLHVVTFHEGADLVAVAPLMVEPGPTETISFLSSEETTDYADLLSVPGQEAAAGHALLEYLDEQRSRGTRVVLEPVPENSPLLADMVGDRPRPGAAAAQVQPCPMISLPRTWDEYLATLSRTDRHELRRKMRRAESAGSLAYEVIQDSPGLGAALPVFYRLHQSSGDARKGQFLEPPIRAFFTDVSDKLADRGWLRLAILRLDDVPVAAILAFERGSTVALYNSGFDPRYRSASPGIVLIALELQSAIQAGHDAFDFLRGDEPYKYDFGAHDRFVWRLSLEPPGSDGRSPIREAAR